MKNMNNNTTIEDRIREMLENDEDLLNECVEALASWNGTNQDEIYYEMDYINEFFSGKDPLWILERGFYGDFCPAHNWFRCDSYGNFESCDFKDYSYLLDDYLIQELIENYTNLDIDELTQAIEEYEEENKDEDEPEL